MVRQARTGRLAQRVQQGDQACQDVMVTKEQLELVVLMVVVAGRGHLA